jgi:hypothetical protein
VKAAELAERVPDIVEEVGVLLDEELGAEVAAGLLIRQHREHDVTRQLCAVGSGTEECRHHHRHAALHVERASSPDPAVRELATERRPRPVLRCGRDDVDVALQQKWCAVAAPLEPRDEVGPRGILRIQLDFATGVFEQAAQVADAFGLVAGRIGRVEPDQLLQQLDRGHSAAMAPSRPLTSSAVL